MEEKRLYICCKILRRNLTSEQEPALSLATRGPIHFFLQAGCGSVMQVKLATGSSHTQKSSTLKKDSWVSLGDRVQFALMSALWNSSLLAAMT